MKRTKLTATMLAAACLAVAPLGRATADEPVDPTPMIQPEEGEPDEGMAWVDDDLGMPLAFRTGLTGEAAHLQYRSGPGGWRRGGGGRGFALQGLELTDEQQKKIADIRDTQTRANIQARGNLQIAQLDLRKLIRVDKPDQRAINAQIDRIGTMRTNLQKSRISSMLEIRAVLTPEQRQQLRENIEHGRRSGSGHSDRKKEDGQ